MEEEEPNVGNSEEDEPNIEENNVSGPQNPTATSDANAQPASVDEPSFYTRDIFIQDIGITLIIKQEIH